MSAVRKVTRLPIIPKLTPNVTDVASFARAAEQAGADAVSLVNTFLAMAIDVHTRRPKLTNIVGGLSGPAIRPIAVRMVYECRQAVKLPIIGMGGIATADDVLEFMIAGATAVQVGTANFVDPFIWTRLLDGLRAYMTRHGLTRLADLTGSHRHDEEGNGLDQLLIALDVDSAAKALALADALRGVAGGFKVGSQLFTSEGPSIVRALVERGDRVFLDLKFHDIPNTVAGSVAAAAALGVWMVNVHASGGTRMMQAASDAAYETAARTGGTRPLVIAVTVLTSMDARTLTEINVGRPVLDQVLALSQLAQAAGLDGVVASPLEIAAIRRQSSGVFAIVTPGIRGGAAAARQGRSGTDDGPGGSGRGGSDLHRRRTADHRGAGPAGRRRNDRGGVDPADRLTAAVPRRRCRGGSEPPLLRRDDEVPAAVLEPPYFAVTMKCPRRFCCQQLSVSSEQAGCSSPLLTVVTRSVGTPRLTM